MSSTPEMSASAEIIRLKGSMTISNACDFRETLLEQLPSSGNAVMDLGEVAEMDITGLQLLCAAHRTMIKRGLDLRLVQPLPEAVREAACLSGLEQARSCGAGLDETCIWTNGAEDE